MTGIGIAKKGLGLLKKKRPRTKAEMIDSGETKQANA